MKEEHLQDIAKKIIQILLYEGTAVKKTDLPKILNLDQNEKEELIKNFGEVFITIKKNILPLGLLFLENESSVEICLSKEINNLISQNKREELKNDLSESALQTLAVIVYRQNATKAEVDFVRGVDSSRSLKTLLLRGLIEKNEEKNKRKYFVSLDTLKFLGLENIEQVPDFLEINDKLKTLIEGE